MQRYLTDYPALAIRYFTDLDADGNGFLESLEWLEYLHRNKTYEDPEAEKSVVDKQR